MEKQKEPVAAAVRESRAKGTLVSGSGKTQLLWLVGALFVLLCLLLARQGTRTDTLEERLAAALSQLEGAGSVEVVIYQEKQETDSTGATAVFSIMGASSAQQTERPSGVLVLAQGADDLRVRLEIARAVQALLGVPAANIEVLKKAN